MLPRLAQSLTKQRLHRQEEEQVESVKYYEKVYEQFPGDNIRANAIKYLYFRVKPAGYLLPYLQEEGPQESSSQAQQPKPAGNSFNWRSLFANDKHKKEEKLTVAQLANSQEFKRVESKLEAAFKHAL